MTDKIRMVILLAPAMLVLVGLFGGGLVLGIFQSFNFMPVIGLMKPNIGAYVAVLSSWDFYLSLILSLYIAICSTIISTILAIAIALLLRSGLYGRSVIRFLFQLNLTIPHLIGAIGILYLFSQSGSFARLAYQFGLIAESSQFPALIFDPYAFGIILQYVWKEVPFIGLIALANMQTLGENYEMVARSLGASRWQSIRHVLLPMLLPAIAPAVMIVFGFIFAAYEVPALLGASYPETLPVLAYRKFTDADLSSRPEAMVIAIMIAATSIGLLFLCARWIRNSQPEWRR